MANIKAVSDLRNYASILSEVHENEPVYLTKNGRGAYAIVDIRDIEEYEKLKAKIWLLSDIRKGIESADENGWLTDAEIRRRINEKWKD